MFKKGKPKESETESLLITTQNHDMKTINVKTKIDKTQLNSKYRQCGEKYETIIHIESECTKLW